jgi:hypothetical protein
MEPQGDSCETPQQRKDRQRRNREACTRFVKIKVRAHTKRVCVSGLVEHELHKLKRHVKQEIKSAARKELVKLGVPKPIAGALTGKRRRRARLPSIKIPGLEGASVDPNVFIPKGKRPSYERVPSSNPFPSLPNPRGTP